MPTQKLGRLPTQAQSMFRDFGVPNMRLLFKRSDSATYKRYRRIGTGREMIDQSSVIALTHDAETQFD